MAFEPFFCVAREAPIGGPCVLLDGLRTGLTLEIYASRFSKNRSLFSGCGKGLFFQLAHKPTSPISTELPAGSRT